jgi:hypothetical protein
MAKKRNSAPPFPELDGTLLIPNEAPGHRLILAESHGGDKIGWRCICGYTKTIARLNYPTALEQAQQSFAYHQHDMNREQIMANEAEQDEEIPYSVKALAELQQHGNLLTLTWEQLYDITEELRHNYPEIDYEINKHQDTYVIRLIIRPLDYLNSLQKPLPGKASLSQDDIRAIKRISAKLPTLA